MIVINSDNHKTLVFYFLLYIIFGLVGILTTNMSSLCFLRVLAFVAMKVDLEIYLARTVSDYDFYPLKLLSKITIYAAVLADE